MPKGLLVDALDRPSVLGWGTARSVFNREGEGQLVSGALGVVPSSAGPQELSSAPGSSSRGRPSALA